ncbi:DUF6714 family protein [Pseudomonas sp. ES1]|uniref:DUF6714 family protein n=1 Tax=Pseudomonas sp. ES1 TaxID=3424775 RepID=UPI003D346766
MREHNSLSEAQLEMRSEVELAFGKRNPPRADEIINTEFIEPTRIRNFFNGRAWWDITLEVLWSDYSGGGSACLSFMSPKGRNYYLPLYLLLAVEHYYKGDAVTLDFASRLLMYAKDDHYYKISTLNGEEMKAIAKVLRFLASKYDDKYAQEALDYIWKDYLQ